MGGEVRILDLVGTCIGTADKDGGAQELGCGAVARRLVAKAFCAVRKQSIMEAASEHHTGEGVPVGLEEMHGQSCAEIWHSFRESAFTRVFQ